MFGVRPDLRLLAERVFLGLTVWREARGASADARAGVAWSVLNRVARPSWWGRDVLGVLAKRWQYSSLTDPRDPQLTRWPTTEDTSWWECLATACDVLDGLVPNPVPGADSYHDQSIAPPEWAARARRVATLGRLTFYDVDRDHELPLTGQTPA